MEIEHRSIGTKRRRKRMAWPKLEGGRKDIVKLQDGNGVVGVLRGDPHLFRVHWVEQRTRVCTGEGCETCGLGNKSKFRFRSNFIVSINKTLTAQVLEQGFELYSTIQAYSESCDLSQQLVEIRRKGSGKNDTTYLFLLKEKLSADQLAKVNDVALIPLTDAPQEQGLDGFGEAGLNQAPSEDDCPF